MDDVLPIVGAGLVLIGAVAGGLYYVSGRARGGRSVWFLYAAMGVYCRLIVRRRANRLCPFPDGKPALIIANHRSPVDPILLWYGHRRRPTGTGVRAVPCLMAKEYAEVPIVGRLCRMLQAIPIDRDGHDMRPMREALRHLKGGEWVGIFPEGRLNDGDDLLPAGPGVAWLAVRSKAPIYPVYIHNAPRGKSMLGSFFRFAKVRVTYGDPIELDPKYLGKPSREMMQEVANYLMEKLAELGGVRHTPMAVEDEEEGEVEERRGGAQNVA